MKKLILFFLIMFLVLITKAQTVKIGNQVWMVMNLNVDKFRNGDPIPQAKTDEEWERASKNKQPAWCYLDNDPVNGEKYGKLYNWYAVNDPRKLAPFGYHVPSDKEWTQLSVYLGGEREDARKMKDHMVWKEFPYYGNNESGFSALPCGTRSWDGRFVNYGLAFWWSSTLFSDNQGWSRYLRWEGSLFRSLGYKGEGYSVRCIKD